MTDQAKTAPAAPSLSVLTLNWLTRILFFNGFYGALAFIRLAVPTRHAYQPLTFGAIASSPFALHMFLAMEALVAITSGCFLFETIKRRRKPAFSPSLPDKVKQRGRRSFAAVVLVYALIYASMINPAHIQWTPLLICGVIAYLGWRMVSWSTELLPKAPPLEIDPMSVPAMGPAAPAFEPSTGQMAQGKQKDVYLWLKQPNPRILLTERPRIQIVLAQVMAAIMFAGGVYLLWSQTTYHHPVMLFSVMFIMSLFCCMLLLSEASPQRLEIDLVGRTYRYSDYRPLKRSMQFGTIILRWPFIMEHQTGELPQDFKGVGIRVRYGKATTYAVNLVWNDSNRPPITVGATIDEDKAITSMEEAAAKLDLPALGRILPQA